MSKLTTVFWLGGIPPFAVFKYHDPEQGHCFHLLRRARKSCGCSGADDPGCAAGVMIGNHPTAWMRILKGGLRRSTKCLPFFILYKHVVLNVKPWLKRLSQPLILSLLLFVSGSSRSSIFYWVCKICYYRRNRRPVSCRERINNKLIQ